VKSHWDFYFHWLFSQGFLAFLHVFIGHLHIFFENFLFSSFAHLFYVLLIYCGVSFSNSVYVLLFNLC
jgi:hypothetical protein